MNNLVQNLRFEEVRGFLLPRLSYSSQGCRYYHARNLSVFSIWKHEVRTKLGDECRYEIIQQTKHHQFEIKLLSENGTDQQQAAQEV